MISTIFTEGEFLYWKKNEGYLQICPAMLDRVSKVLTQILQGGYYGVNLELQLVLFDLDAPDPLLHVALLLLSGTESQHEVLGGLDDLPADLPGVEAGGADHVLLVGVDSQPLVREVGVEQEDPLAGRHSPEDVPTLQDGADLPPQPAGGDEPGQPASASQEVCGVP